MPAGDPARLSCAPRLTPCKPSCLAPARAALQCPARLGGSTGSLGTCLPPPRPGPPSPGQCCSAQLDVGLGGSSCCGASSGRRSGPERVDGEARGPAARRRPSRRNVSCGGQGGEHFAVVGCHSEILSEASAVRDLIPHHTFHWMVRTSGSHCASHRQWIWF